MNEFSKILLVDDDFTFSLLAEEVLKKTFSVSRAVTLQAGLCEMDMTKFDLVLLDLNLPDSRGLDTFLKLHQAHPCIATIILSGLEDRDLATRAIENGAQDYIYKSCFDQKCIHNILLFAIERNNRLQKIMSASMDVAKCITHLNSIIGEKSA